MIKCEENEIHSARTKYFGSGNTYFLFLPIFFLGFACLSRTWPPVCRPSTPLYLLQLCWHWLSQSWGICCADVCVCVCAYCTCVYLFTVSGSAACWEGRYLKRFCNRADTVSRLTSPLGISGALESRVVGVGKEIGERATGDGIHVYLEIWIKSVWFALWLHWA